MKYKKILIEIHHGLGDVVQMIPLINNLRMNYEDAEIAVIVASEMHASILGCTGLVDKYYFLNLRNMTLNEIINFIKDIRREKFDIAFLSPISNKRLGALLLYFLGCKYRVREVSENYRLFSKNDIVVVEETKLHRVDRNLKLLESAGIKIYNRNPFIMVDNVKKVSAQKMLANIHGQEKKLIGICIGTNPVHRKKGFMRIPYEAKKWDLNNYINLIDKLKDKVNIILLGGKKEEEELKEVVDSVENSSVLLNLINKTTVIESISLINECDLVVGGDTGMLHVADALGKNTLTIFGPTNPKIVGPYSERSNNVTLNLDCQYCYGTETLFECTDRKCLKKISVEDIYGKILGILKNMDEERE